VANSAAVQAQQKELAVVEAEFADLKKRYKSKHPFYIRAVEKIASIHDSIDKQAQIIVAALKNSSRTAKATEERSTLVDNQKKEQLNVEQLRIQYSVLKREAEAADLLTRPFWRA